MLVKLWRGPAAAGVQQAPGGARVRGGWGQSMHRAQQGAGRPPPGLEPAPQPHPGAGQPATNCTPAPLAAAAATGRRRVTRHCAGQFGDRQRRGGADRGRVAAVGARPALRPGWPQRDRKEHAAARDSEPQRGGAEPDNTGGAAAKGRGAGGAADAARCCCVARGEIKPITPLAGAAC